METLFSGEVLSKILMETVTDFVESKWLLILLLAIAWLMIWLLIREIKTWYWKINDILVLLKKIEENTNQNNNIIIESKQPEIQEEIKQIQQ